MQLKCQLCTKAVVAAVALSVILVLSKGGGAMVINGTEMTMDQAIMAASKSSRIFNLMEDANTVLVEMDMLFKTEEWEKIMRHRSNASRQARKAIRDSRFRWPSATVPYRIALSFTQSENQQLQDAIADYGRYTCLKIRPAEPNDKNYVEIVDGDGCKSFVGIQGGRQLLTLASGCRKKGIIIHELGHAIGFNHEQTRPDRGDYVDILKDNISPSMAYNFQQYTDAETNNFNVPYDYLSVMHYGPYAFSQNGQRTILTKDERYQNKIGSRVGFSFRDVKLANAMYDCSTRSKCPQKNCPLDGFVGPDCHCWCDSGNDTAPVQLCSATSKVTSTAPTSIRTSTAPLPSLTTSKRLFATVTAVKPSMMASVAMASTIAPCRDNSGDCTAWAKQGYCTHSQQKVYMAEHCRMSCNICYGSGASPTSSAASTNTRQRVSTTATRATATTSPRTSCHDANHMCPEWANLGECLKNSYYMNSHCAKSCHSCHDDSYSQGCEDGDQDCSFWTSQGHCHSESVYSSYMQLQCPHSCGYCTTTNPQGPVYRQDPGVYSNIYLNVQVTVQKAARVTSRRVPKLAAATMKTTTRRPRQQQQLKQKPLQKPRQP